MKLLVCGAGGMLGHDVVRAAEHEVTALARADLDVTDVAAVRDAVAAARPDAVVNCAAWTDVDGAEDHEEDATRVNEDGAGTVSAAAAEIGAAWSTSRATTSSTAPRTSPTWSRTPPRLCRPTVAPSSPARWPRPARTARHFIVRSSWLFGSHGGNFVATMLRLGRERDELNVVHDQVGCPTWTGHLAEGLLDLVAGDAHGIHHLAGTGECSWCEFAREIFRQANVACEVHPIGTDEYPRPARRPAYSVLSSTRGLALPPWQEGLAAYLGEREALPA